FESPVKTKIFDVIQELCRSSKICQLDRSGNYLLQIPFCQKNIDIRNILGHYFIEKSPAHSGINHLFIEFPILSTHAGQKFDGGMKICLSFVKCDPYLIKGIKSTAGSFHFGKVSILIEFLTHIIQSQYHIL